MLCSKATHPRLELCAFPVAQIWLRWLNQFGLLDMSWRNSPTEIRTTKCTVNNEFFHVHSLLFMALTWARRRGSCTLPSPCACGLLHLHKGAESSACCCRTPAKSQMGERMGAAYPLQPWGCFGKAGLISERPWCYVWSSGLGYVMFLVEAIDVWKMNRAVPLYSWILYPQIQPTVDGRDGEIYIFEHKDFFLLIWLNNMAWQLFMYVGDIIHMVLGFISNLRMIWSIWKNILRL